MDQNYKSEEHRKRIEALYKEIDEARAKHTAELNEWIENKKRERRAEKEQRARFQLNDSSAR